MPIVHRRLNRKRPSRRHASRHAASFDPNPLPMVGRGKAALIDLSVERGEGECPSSIAAPIASGPNPASFFLHPSSFIPAAQSLPSI